MSGCGFTPAGMMHVAALQDAMSRFDEVVDTADRWGRQLAGILSGGNRLLALGNGGSAAQAQHLTGELVGRYRDDRPPFSAIALHAETSALTAIANDYPPEELFARQVHAHGRPGDVLVAMSTSGRSVNAVAAAQRARDCGLVTWAFTGPRPNPLAEVCDEAIVIDSPWTATVQELHLVALHMLCASFDVALGVTEPAQAHTTSGVLGIDLRATAAAPA